MLFMGPQMLLDLFAQFKQSLDKVTEAHGQHSAYMIARAACDSDNDLMAPAVGKRPQSHARQQQHAGAATSPQASQSTGLFAKSGP